MLRMASLMNPADSSFAGGLLASDDGVSAAERAIAADQQMAED
jgi:hypothetical protein